MSDVVDVGDRDDALFRGEPTEGVLPHLDRLAKAPRVADDDFPLT